MNTFPADPDIEQMLVEQPIGWTCYGFYQGCGCPTCQLAGNLQKSLIATQRQLLNAEKGRGHAL